MFGFPIGILIGFATTRTKISFSRNPLRSISMAALGLLVLPGVVTALWFLEPLQADPWLNLWELLSIIASLGGFGYGLLVNQSLSSNKKRFALSLASVYIRGIALLLLFVALIEVLSILTGFPSTPFSGSNPYGYDFLLYIASHLLPSFFLLWLSATSYLLSSFLFWLLLGLMLNRSNLIQKRSKKGHAIELLCYLFLTGIFALLINFPLITLFPVMRVVFGFILLLIGVKAKRELSGFKLKYKYTNNQMHPTISWKHFFAFSS
jgi:hypothetical protein